VGEEVKKRRDKERRAMFVGWDKVKYGDKNSDSSLLSIENLNDDEFNDSLVSHSIDSTPRDVAIIIERRR